MRVSATKTKVKVGARELTVTNLSKLYWPDDGYTKGDYLSYCHSIAPWLLPHLADRPLVVTRYPDGIHGQWFYQKNLPDYAPDWINSFPYWSKESQRWLRFIVCSDLETLIWVANQGALELHPWLSQVDSFHIPDFAVIDLDPAEGVGFREACQVALLLRELLTFLGLDGYPKTTGATGLHIYIPVAKRYDYHFTANFVRHLGIVLQTIAPELITLERLVPNRVGKVYVDYLQNALGKTLVSVYSTRPLPGGTVSFPIKWDEVGKVDPGEFTLRTVPALLKRRGDLFAPALTHRQHLDAAWKKLQGLSSRMLAGAHQR